MPDWFAASAWVRGLKFKAVIAEGIIETIKKGR